MIVEGERIVAQNANGDWLPGKALSDTWDGHKMKVVTVEFDKFPGSRHNWPAHFVKRESDYDC